MFPLAQLVLVLFAEAVSSREEVPAPLLIHLPYIGLLWMKENNTMAAQPLLSFLFYLREERFVLWTHLTRMFSFILINEVHQEESVEADT